MKTFNKEFMSQFEAEHVACFPKQKITGGGYPDCGSGIYSQKLSYKAWFDFNCAQRAQGHFLEYLNYYMVAITIGAFGNYITGWMTLGGSLAILIGRFAFSLGYAKFGPSSRKFGYYVFLLGGLVCLAACVWSIVLML